jgi:predicted DCC family thiol-disulfide oxidoreductase YuxK
VTDSDSSEQPLLVFDGVCVLCSASVRFILAHESDHELRFTVAQSALGQRVLREAGVDTLSPNSFVLRLGSQVHLKSEAALKVAQHLRWPWRLSGCLGLLPRSSRDWLYDRVANNRYRLFGQSSVCMVPSPAHAHRFLS